jgi:hypothetical protein
LSSSDRREPPSKGETWKSDNFLKLDIYIFIIYFTNGDIPMISSTLSFIPFVTESSSFELIDLLPALALAWHSRALVHPA